jgi:hypothetical protein
MTQNILTDKDQFPTPKVVFSHIGKSKAYWDSIFNSIHTKHPDFNEEWRYYLDGKSWLMKVTRKTKTIFWLSIVPESFQITFYFGDKAETAILKSTISETLKLDFKEGKRYGKIRGITIIPKNQQDTEDILTLIDIKVRVK